MTETKKPICYICVDTEYTAHYSSKGNSCFAFAAVVVEPIKLGDDIMDKQVRDNAMISAHSFRPERTATSSKSTREFWQQEKNKTLFGKLLSEVGDTKGEMQRFRSLCDSLKLKYKRVDLIAWPASVDAPVIDSLMYRTFPGLEGIRDWTIGWKCVRSVYETAEDVYRPTLEKLQSMYGKQHDPLEDATWAALLWVHMKANPPDVEVGRVFDNLVKEEGLELATAWLYSGSEQTRRWYRNYMLLTSIEQPK